MHIRFKNKNKLKFDKQLTFLLLKISINTAIERNVQRCMIGALRYNKSWLTPIIIEKTFNEANLSNFVLEERPNDLAILPDGKWVAVNFSFNGISIYDRDFKLIKKIDFDLCDLYRIATNGLNIIYFTEISERFVAMLDIDLNCIKKYSSAEHCSEEDKINPYGICYEKNHVYFCDCNNRCIVQLTSDLVYVKSFKLDYAPWVIKSVINTICIKGKDLYELCFYDIETFVLKQKYTYERNVMNGYGRLSVIGSYFYETLTNLEKLNVYDDNGAFIKDIDISRVTKHINTKDIFINESNNELFISSYFKKVILVLKTQC